VYMEHRAATLESAISNYDLAAGEETAELLMNEEAFADFYRKTVRPFWAYLSRVSGSGTLADDLVQESYLRFLCAKAPWEAGEAACTRYLFRIGTNLVRDYRRRPCTASLEEVPEQKLPVLTPREFERLDSESLLDAGLARLRPLERQLLWLAHAEGFSYREISEITGLGVARIRLTLFRSRHKLARALRQQMLVAEVRG
jgi:RNA polymerase sigma-70 factor (ECF subfamily)